MKTLIKFLAATLAVILIISTQNANAQLSGTKTIGPSGNYSTFNAARAALSAGVSGPVVFNVASGTYNEKVTFTAVTGASATNTITFQAASGDSTDVILQGSATSSADGTVVLNGADYFIFKKMTIKTTSTSSYRILFNFRSTANYNEISNCVLQGSYNSSSYASAIYAYSGNNEFNTIDNNVIKDCYAAIYWRGTGSGATSLAEDIVISNNQISNYYSYGMYLYYHDGVQVIGNTLNGSAYYGIYCYYVDNDAKFSKNIINNTGSYGIHFYYCDGTAANRFEVSNNFITGATSYGIYDRYPKYRDYYYNSINCSGSYGFYFYNSSSTYGYHNIKNNNFVNTGSGYAAYIYNGTTYVTSCDNNNYYSPTGSFVYYSGTRSNLAAVKLASSTRNQNSVSVDPQYTSSTDLHTGSIALDGAGTPVTLVTDDIDGETRHATTPDIGADEYLLVANDAGVTAMGPSAPCPGSSTIIATVKNYGIAVLNSVVINWSVNGVTQTPFSYTTAIGLGAEAQVPIGSYTFAAGVSYNLIFWTTLPNGVADQQTSNDSYTKTGMQTAMSGIFTIGGTSPDYATFAAAVSDLTTKGVCGAVTFNVANGTYPESVTIPEISGASATNTITFQAASGDSTDVILQGSSTGTTTGTVVFNGADYVKFKKMTVKTTSTGSYRQVFNFAAIANYNEISNCVIQGSYNSSSYASAIYAYDGNNEFNTIDNNVIKDCYAAIYWRGTSTASSGLAEHNVFSNNQISNYYSYGIYMYYHDGVQVISNTVTGSANYGVYFNYCDNDCKFSKNKIHNAGSYGIYMYYCDGTSTNRWEMSNNFISGATSYAIYNRYPKYHDVYYNSINVNNGSYGFYFYNSSSTYGYHNIKNNNFVNQGAGYAAYIYNGTTYLTSCDYNNYYSPTGNFVYYSGTRANLAAIKLASSTRNQNSVSVDPQYTSASDLHTGSLALDSAGTPIAGITTDIDGETRDAVTPDIGADEFLVVVNDAGVTAMAPAAPCAGSNTIIATVKNYGIVVLNSVVVNWSVNGVTQTPFSYSTPIAIGADAQVSIGSYTFVTGVTYNLIFWTTLPNGVADLQTSNDSYTESGLLTAMSGIFTIGGTSPDYATFAAAVSDLTTKGVCGAVTFNVANGTYPESVTIPEISGASATNTITFQAASGDSTDVILQGSSTGTTTGTVVFNGADYVKFKKMTVKTTSTGSYRQVFNFAAIANYNEISNCVIQGSYNSSSYASAIYAYDGNNEFNTIDNNVIKDCYAAIYWRGTSTASSGLAEHNVFSNNQISNYYSYGIYLYYHDAVQVIGNTITGSASYGIYCYYLDNETKFSKNNIQNTSSYGIRFYYCDGTSTNRFEVSNNFISGATSYGIYTNASGNHDYYNNSFNVNNGSYGFYLYNSSTTYGYHNVVNNNFVNEGSGYAAYIYNGTTYLTSCDYNNYYSPTGNFVYYSGTKANLAAVKLASSTRNQNSVSMDPAYISTTNLHTKSLAFNDLGTPLTLVTDDIDGDTRSATTPDIGADEYTPPARDIAVTAISPFNTVSGNQNILINFTTFGTANLTSAQFNYSVNGTPGTTPSTWTGNLANGQSATNVNIGSFNFQPGQNIIKAWPAVVNGGADEDNSNDTATYTFTITVDAGIIAMDEAGIQYGSSPVNAFIANYGTDNLVSTTLGWSVNGVAQTPANWTGMITSTNADGPAFCGNYTFGAGTYIIKIWTQAPNGTTPPDYDNTNDTLTKNFTFTLDAGISQIDPPGLPGAQNVVAHIKNFANIPLTSATIYYQVNGGTPATYSWSGNLAPNAVDGPITIGTATFSYGAQSIKAWTNSPNAGTDALATNDTTLANFNITSDIGIVGGDVNPQVNCGRGNDTLKLEIKNFGTGPVSGPFSISYKEGTSTTITETVPSSVTIQPGATYWHTFAALINLTVTGMDSTFNILGWTTLATDANNSNDTAGGPVESWYTPTAPTTTGATVTYGNSATLGATKINGDSLNWYDAMTGGNLVNTGASFTTPPLFDTTNYYVSAQSYGAGQPPVDVTIGTGTITQGYPFYTFYMDSRTQMLYTASELNAAGAPSSGGYINSLAFNVSSAATQVMNSFTISMKNSTATSITGWDNTGLTTVFQANYSIAGTGWQTINLTTPFLWDGTSNILVNICFDNNSYTSNTNVYSTSASGMNYHAHFDGSSTSGCTTTNSGSSYSTYRPNIKFNIGSPPPPHCESSRTPVTAIVTNIPSDAGISAIEDVTSSGTQNVNVTLKNFTAVVLDSARIDYEVNGTPGATYYWSGSLGNNGTANLTLGSGTFIYGSNTIKAWSTHPNGSTDPNPNNDTTLITFNIVADIGVVAVHEPIGGCGLGNETVIVDIVNFGTETVNSYVANFSVSGGTPVTENITTPLLPGDTNTYTFTATANLATTVDSTFEIWAYTTLATDIITNNDSTLSNVWSGAEPSAPIGENDTISYGNPAQLVATTAISSDTVFWYNALSGGTSIAKGDTFNTAPLFDTTTFYAESQNYQTTAGSGDYIVGTGTSTSYYVPMYMSSTGSSFRYSKYAGIYTAAELIAAGSSSGLINKISFNKSNSCGYTASNATCKIYIKHVGATVPSSSWATLISGATLTYTTTTQNINTSAGWQEFNFSTPFNWDGSSNVLVMLEWYRPSAHTCNYPYFLCSSVSSTTCYRAGSSSSPTTLSGYTLRPNAKFNMNTLIVVPTCPSTRTAVTAVVNNFPALDAGVLKVNGPISGPGKTNAETLNITVKNYGTVNVDTIPVAYVLDGGSPVIDTVFASLNPGDTANFTFTATMNMSALATYNVNSYTTLSGDVITGNDGVNVQIIHSDYCISRSTSTADGDIGNVTIKHPVTNADLLNKGIAMPEFNNILSNKFYSDFTGLTPTILQQGQTYPAMVSQITASATRWASNVGIWIDFNQDGVLDAVTERVFTGATTTGTTPGSLMLDNMTIPANALLGNTRMRVVINESTVQPCGTYSYGETEDYTVNIVPQVWAEAGPLDTVCPGYPTTLTGSGTGPTYNWSSGSGTTTTVSPAVTTMYYFSVTDTYGFTAVDSTEVYARILPTLTFPALTAMCVDASALTLNTATPTGGTYTGIGVSGSTFNPAIAGAGTHSITYSYSDVYGCIDSTTQTIVVNPLPVLTLGTLPGKCIDAPLFALNFASPTGGTYAGTGVDASGNFTPATAGVGTHYVTYTYTDGNACTSIDSTTQTVNALPVVTLASFSDVCIDATTFALSGGSPTAGTYSGTGVSAGSFNPATATIGTHTITYTYTDGNSCINSDTSTITVNALPVVTLASFTDVCVDAATFTLSGGLPTGGTYSGTGVSAGSFNPATATVGTHTITYTYTDGNSCTNSATATITVNALPVLTLGTLSDVCYDAPLFALNFASPTGGTYSGAGVDASGNFTAATAGSGYHYITYTYTDGNACTNIDSVHQKVNALPVLTATATPDTVYWGTPTSLDVSVASGPSNPINPPTSYSYSYSWTPIDSLSATGQATLKSPTTKNLFAPNTFTVLVTNSTTSCSNSTQVNVMIKGGPLSTTPIATPDTVCLGSPVQLNAQASGGSENYTYAWTSIPAGFTSALASPIVNPTVSTTYYVAIYDGFNNTGGNVAVYVHSLPTATTTLAADSICLGDSVNLSVTLTGQSPWTLYTLSGSGAGTVPGVAASPWTIWVNPAANESYYVDSLIDGNGCFNTSAAQTDVVVHALPTVLATGSDTMCYGDSIQFTLTFTGESPWEFDVTHTGATQTSSGTETGITNPFTVWADDMESTVHSITRLKDGYGCEITGSPIDSVYSFVRTQPTVAITPDTVFHCLGDSSMVAFTFTGPGPWNVTISDGTQSMVETVTSSPWTPYANDAISKWYYVTSVIDSNGCTNTIMHDSVYVNVWPLPTPSFTGLAADYCIDAPIATLTGIPSGGTFSGTGISANTFDPATAGLGTKIITYTYTDANMCTNSTTDTTIINALPIVTLASFADVCVDAATFTLTGGLPTGGTYSGVGGPSTAEIGTSTTTQGYPFYTYYMDSRTQMLYTASELTTAGASAGNISSIAFYVTSAASQTMNGFTISMKNSTATSSTAWDNTGLTTVYQANYSVAGTGWQTINLSTPFLWDGTSNVLVNICFNNNSYTSNSYVRTSYAPNMTRHYHFDGSSTSGCATTSGSSYSYRPNMRFSIAPLSPISGGSFNPALAGAGTHTVIYSYTDGNSCTNSDTSSITVNALPIVTLASFADVCVDAATFTLTGGLPSGGTYSGTAVSAGGFNPATATAGTHTITYTYTDGNSCINSDSSTITVNALPTPTFTGLASAYCVDATAATLTGIPAGGTFSGLGISGNTFDPATAGVGTKIITYTYTDANMCTNSTTDSTIVNALPVVSFSGYTTPQCVDAAINTLAPTPTGGSFIGLGISGNTFDPAVAGAGTHTITYMYTDANGCFNSASNILVVNALPIVSFSGLNAAYCADDAASVLTGTPTGGTFSGTGIAAGTFDPAVATAGTYQIAYAYTDANSCLNSDTQTVVVNAVPTVSFTGLQAVYCSNEAVDTLTGIPAGGVFTGAGITGNVYDPLMVSGADTVIYTYTDANSCMNVDTQFVIVNTAPAVSFTGLSTIYCTTIAPDTLVGTPTGGTFAGSGITGNIFDPTMAIPDSVLTITYTYTDTVTGCSDFAFQNVYVSVSPNPVAGVDSTITCGDTLLLGDTAVIPGVVYSWTPAIGLSDPTIFNPSAYPIVTTLYTLTITDTITNCFATANVLITVTAGPTINAGADVTICEGDTVTLTATGATIFSWSNGDSTAAITVNPTVTTTYIVTGYTVAGCGSVDTVVVTVNPAPFVDAGMDASIICGISSAVQIGSTPITGFTYSWTPTDSLSDPAIANPIANPNMTTIYTVVVTDTVSGCSSTDNVLITVTGGPTAYAGADTTICFGNSVMLTATGGPKYKWSTGDTTASITVTPTVDTYYVVIVTDSASNCASSDTVVVMVDHPVTDLGPDVTTCDATVTLDAGVGFASYIWSTGGTTRFIIIDSAIVGHGNNTYSVTVTNVAGCTATDDVDVNLVNCTGLEEITDGMNVKLYPNPTKGQFQIDISGLNSNTLDMCITNMAGQIIFCEKLNNVNSAKYTKALDFSNYPKGVYFIRLTTKDVVLTERVIVQ